MYKSLFALHSKLFFSLGYACTNEILQILKWYNLESGFLKHIPLCNKGKCLNLMGAKMLQHLQNCEQ